MTRSPRHRAPGASLVRHVRTARSGVLLLARFRERGSAIAEFVMVAGLLIVLGMGVIQMGIVLHVRNTIVACAAEGARAGARADADTGEAAARTRALVTESVGAAYANEVSARRTRTAEGVVIVEVRVVAPVPIVGLLGPSGTMTLVGRAFDERQVTPP